MPDPDSRFTLANERTFLAWNRTALALIGGGLAIEQFLKAGRAGRLLLALPLIAIGATIALASYSRWQAVQRSMERGEPLPPTRLPALVAATFAVLSLGAAVFSVAHAL